MIPVNLLPLAIHDKYLGELYLAGCGGRYTLIDLFHPVYNFINKKHWYNRDTSNIRYGDTHLLREALHAQSGDIDNQAQGCRP